MIKKFNSKYAAEMPEPSELEQTFGGGGFSIFNSENARARLQEMQSADSDVMAEKEEERPTVQQNDHNKFSPIKTIALQPLNRALHETNVYTNNENSGKLELTPVLETYEHDPKKWIEKVKRVAKGVRDWRINNPVRAEANKKHRKHFWQNVNNRNLANAVGLTLPEMLRQSVYRHQPCDGAGCAGCNNLGYNSNAAMSMFDMKQSAAASNADISFHRTYCDGESCNPNCALKQMIDERIRIPHREKYGRSKKLVKADVLGDINGNTELDRRLSYTVVDDQFKPTLPGLVALGNVKPGEKLKKFSFGHFANYDLENPDSDFQRTLSPETYQANQHVYNAGGGGRDKQMFFSVVNVNDNDTYDILYSYQPMDKIREEKADRERGRKGRRSMRFRGSVDGMNVTREMEPRFGEVRRRTANLLNHLAPFRGQERSPLQTPRHYGYLENVPANFLIPMNDEGAADVCYSGEHLTRVEKQKIKNYGNLKNVKDYSAGWRREADPSCRRCDGNINYREQDGTPCVSCRKTEPPKMTANLKVRRGTGWSLDELRTALNTIARDNTHSVLLRHLDELATKTGLVRENFVSDEDYTKARESLDPTLGYQRTPGFTLTQQSQNTNPGFEQYTGPSTRTFNRSNVNDADAIQESSKPTLELPIDDVPTVDDVIGSPGSGNKLFDVIKDKADEQQPKPITPPSADIDSLYE